MMMSAVPNPSDRGVLVIVSSPSGAGKTTLTRRLLDEFKGQLEFSVSYTTRPQRMGETHGKDYWFVSVDKFDEMANAGAFAEHAFVFSNRYGTARAPIDEALGAGRDVVFDVDWQGGRSLSEQWPEDSLKVFILPPSMDKLEQRLRQRATDAPEVIERRLRKAKEELAHYPEYQFLIVNDDLDRAYAVLRGAYLTRRYGKVDRADVPYPLADLWAVVEGHQSEARAHASRLVER